METRRKKQTQAQAQKHKNLLVTLTSGGFVIVVIYNSLNDSK